MSAELEWSPFGVLASDPRWATLAPKDGPPFARDIIEAARERDLGPEHVTLAWEIARLAVGLTSEEGRALVLLALVALNAQREGSTRAPIRDPTYLVRSLYELGATARDVESVRALLGRGRRAPAASSEAVASVLGATGDYRPLVAKGGYLYQQRLLALEERVALLLGERLDAEETLTSASALAAALADVQARAPQSDRPDGAKTRLALSAEQEQAVLMALRSPLSIITGGPGTGKTSVVLALLRVTARLGDPMLGAVALAAPTGKASDRMQRAVFLSLSRVEEPHPADLELSESRPAARTLHRLLGYSPGTGRFLYHENNRLPERLVIVDESSMIDLAVMERLLRALRPDARLVLLGDAEQLPSVEAGAVFRDLCASSRAQGARRVVRLTHSYRMDASDPGGRSVLGLAQRIRAGEAIRPAEEPGAPAVRLRASAEDLELFGAELLACQSVGAREAFLLRWERQCLDASERLRHLAFKTYRYAQGQLCAEEQVELAALFAAREAAQLLCLTRLGPALSGTESVNRYFHTRLLDRAGDYAGAATGDSWAAPGEPVIVTENDYLRGLYNGDQGLVVRAAPDGAGARAQLMVVFSRAEGFVAFPLSALRGRMEPAWAITVHKAQGSEYERVAVVLPADDSRLLTRETLYTAVTRARRGVVVVGQPEQLARAIDRAMERFSGLAEALG